jgi:hypothetical protein
VAFFVTAPPARSAVIDHSGRELVPTDQHRASNFFIGSASKETPLIGPSDALLDIAQSVAFFVTASPARSAVIDHSGRELAPTVERSLSNFFIGSLARMTAPIGHSVELSGSHPHGITKTIRISREFFGSSSPVTFALPLTSAVVAMPHVPGSTAAVPTSASTAHGARGATTLAAGSIVGIIIGALAIVALVSLVVWFVMIRSSAKRDEYSASFHSTGHGLDSETSLFLADFEQQLDFSGHGCSGSDGQIWEEAVTETRLEMAAE